MLIVEAKKHFKERAIEWWSATMMVLWGAYVLLHPGMFEAMETCQGMLYLAPQHVWGFFAFTAGMVRVAALTVNGFWYPTPLIRLLTSFMGVFVWFWISTGLFLSDIAQMGIVVYAWHMVADMYSAFRSASDTYEAEAQRRLKLLSTTSVDNAGEGSNVRSLYRR